MYEKPVLELPRTIPDEEPVSTELAEIETTFDSFNDEFVDLDDSAPEIEIPFQSKRGPAVREPIYSNPASRPERTLPRAALEQIAKQKEAEGQPVQTAPVDSSDPFQALLDKFNR